MRFFKSHRSLNTPRGLLEMLFRVFISVDISSIKDLKDLSGHPKRSGVRPTEATSESRSANKDL